MGLTKRDIQIFRNKRIFSSVMGEKFNSINISNILCSFGW